MDIQIQPRSATSKDTTQSLEDLFQDLRRVINALRSYKIQDVDLAPGVGGGGTTSAELTAIAALTATTGLLARIGVATWIHRLIAAGTNIAVSNGDGVAGNPTIALSGLGSTIEAWDADLDALAALAGTGLAVRSMANTWVQRTIAAGANISVTNGDGVAGNPTIALSGLGSTIEAWAAILDAIAALAVTGLIARTGAGTVSARTISGGSGISVTNGDGVSGNPSIAMTGTTITDATPKQGLYLYNAARRQFGDAWRVGANGASTLESIGFSNGLTVNGTATETRDARRTWLGLATAATTGTQAGIAAATTQGYGQIRQEPFFVVRIRMGANIANMRFWCGMADINTAPVDADVSTAKGVMFRYSTVAGDTGFRGTQFDGTTQTTTANLETVIASHEYELSFRVNNAGADVDFAVRDVTAGTTTSANLVIAVAGISTDLAVNFTYYFTRENVAKTVEFAGGHFDTGIL